MYCPFLLPRVHRVPTLENTAFCLCYGAQGGTPRKPDVKHAFVLPTSRPAHYCPSSKIHKQTEAKSRRDSGKTAPANTDIVLDCNKCYLKGFHLPCACYFFPHLSCVTQIPSFPGIPPYPKCVYFVIQFVMVGLYFSRQ